MRIVDVNVIIVHETDKAYLTRWDADEEPVWIPKSVAELTAKSGMVAVMSLPENYALDKGMI